MAYLLLLIGCASTLPGPAAFTPCPDTPNCVSSRADPGDDQHYVAPIPYSGPPAEAQARLKAIAMALPRTTLEYEAEGELRFSAASLVFRFVDDLAFALDEEAEVIHVRSASRVGGGDLGVNRRRVERIRARWSERR